MQLSKYKDDILFLVEPSYHGMQYIETANRIQCEYVIIRRENAVFKHDSEETLIVDIFDIDAVTRAINNRLLRREYKNIGIIPCNDFCVPIVSEINEKFHFRTNSKEASLGTRNKIIMRKFLNEGKVNCPKSTTYSSIDEIMAARDQFVFPLVVKPPDMSSSLFVKLVYNFSQLLEAAENIFRIETNLLNYPIYKAVMIEEYAMGPEFSVELFLEDGNIMFSNVTEKHKGPLPHFVEIGHVVPSVITNEKENEALIKAGLDTVKAIGLKYGPVHAEMVLTETGPSIIEVAARIGGDNIMKLVKLATGVYIPELVIEQSLNYKIPTIVKKNEGAAIKFLYAIPGKVVAIEGIEKIKENSNLIDFHIDVSINDYVSPLESSEERLGYIITKGKDGIEANQIACDLANKIQIITEPSFSSESK